MAKSIWLVRCAHSMANGPLALLALWQYPFLPYAIKRVQRAGNKATGGSEPFAVA